MQRSCPCSRRSAACPVLTPAPTITHTFSFVHSTHHLLLLTTYYLLLRSAACFGPSRSSTVTSGRVSSPASTSSTGCGSRRGCPWDGSTPTSSRTCRSASSTAQQHGQSGPLGSAPARLLLLLRARLVVPCSSALPGLTPGHWAPSHGSRCSSEPPPKSPILLCVGPIFPLAYLLTAVRLALSFWTNLFTITYFFGRPAARTEKI